MDWAMAVPMIPKLVPREAAYFDARRVVGSASEITPARWAKHLGVFVLHCFRTLNQAARANSKAVPCGSAHTSKLGVFTIVSVVVVLVPLPW